MLSFNVTPPKSMGPSEAEKRLEEIEKQIEEQMEKEEQAIYFGKHLHMVEMGKTVYKLYKMLWRYFSIFSSL